MAVSFVSVSSRASNGGSGDATGILPSGWQPGDIFICGIFGNDNVNSTLPAGWTAIYSGTDNGSSIRLTVYYRRAESGDTGPLVTHPGGSWLSVIIAAYRGCVSVGSPVDVSDISVNSSSATLTFSSSGVTTTVDGDMVVLLGVADNNGNYSDYTGTPTPTERFDNGEVSVIADFEMSTAGATGSRACTMSLGAQLSIGCLIALKPPPPEAILSPIEVEAIIKQPVVSGSGDATITLTPVTVVSSTKLHSINYMVEIILVPVSGAGIIVNPSMSGSGDAPIVLLPVEGPSVANPFIIAGSGDAPIVLTPVSETSVALLASALGSGSAPITLVPVIVISLIEPPELEGGETLGLPGIYISGAKVRIVKNSLYISKSYGEIGTARLGVSDYDGSMDFFKGQPVSIYNDNGRLVFAGFIEVSEPHRVGVRDPHIIHDIRCIDNRYLAQKRRIVKSYIEKTAGYIADDVFDNYFNAEGLSIGYIEEGLELKQAVFNYLSGTDAMTKLAEKAGMYWEINDFRQFFFKAKTAQPAPWVLTGNDIVKGTLIIRHGNMQYRNRQYVRGPMAETELQHEVHIGNGVTASWALGYPLAKEPVITVDVVPQTVGIKGLEVGKDWYWNKGEENIYAEIAPGDTLEINVDYYGQFPIVYRADDMAEILGRQTVEGVGTGYVDDVIEDFELSSVEAAGELAASKLREYGSIGRTLVFETKKDGLRTGMLLKVNYPERKLTDLEVLITNMDISLIDHQWSYNVTAVEMTAIGGWAKFFSDFITRNQARTNLDIGAGETLVIASNYSETWTASELVTETVTAHPAPAATLFPGATVFP